MTCSFKSLTPCSQSATHLRQLWCIGFHLMCRNSPVSPLLMYRSPCLAPTNRCWTFSRWWIYSVRDRSGSWDVPPECPEARLVLEYDLRKEESSFIKKRITFLLYSSIKNIWRRVQTCCATWRAIYWAEQEQTLCLCGRHRYLGSVASQTLISALKLRL